MPGTVKTSLNYHPATGCQQLDLGSVNMFRRTFDNRQVEVHDIRGRESDFSLDIHGFQLHTHASQHLPLMGTSTVTDAMYSETATMLQKITGATRVHVFSHLIRNASFEEMHRMAAGSIPGTQSAGKAAPARAVHIDQSIKGAQDILHDNMGEKATPLRKTRWAIINVWRPLAPIRHDPLGVCDARSVQDGELVEQHVQLPAESTGDSRYNELSKGRSFGSFRVRHSSAHRWYYASDMTPEETLLIKIFDSRGGAPGTPHTSFVDSTAGSTSSARESLEIRCLVFFENEPEE